MADNNQTTGKVDDPVKQRINTIGEMARAYKGKDIDEEGLEALQTALRNDGAMQPMPRGGGQIPLVANGKDSIGTSAAVEKFLKDHPEQAGAVPAAAVAASAPAAPTTADPAVGTVAQKGVAKEAHNKAARAPIAYNENVETLQAGLHLLHSGDNDYSRSDIDGKAGPKTAQDIKEFIASTLANKDIPQDRKDVLQKLNLMSPDAVQVLQKEIDSQVKANPQLVSSNLGELQRHGAPGTEAAAKYAKATLGDALVATAAAPAAPQAATPQQPATQQQQPVNNAAPAAGGQQAAPQQAATPTQNQQTPEQHLIERQQDQIRRLQEQLSSPQAQMGNRNSMNPYFNQEAGRMGEQGFNYARPPTYAEVTGNQYRNRALDENFELRSRQLDMQEMRTVAQVAQQGFNSFLRLHR